MFKLDEAAEGKSVQNPETVLRPGVVYECHITCSKVLGASRKLKVHMNAHILFQVPLFFFLQCYTYSEFPLKYEHGFGVFFCRGKSVEARFEN